LAEKDAQIAATRAQLKQIEARADAVYDENDALRTDLARLREENARLCGHDSYAEMMSDTNKALRGEEK